MSGKGMVFVRPFQESDIDQAAGIVADSFSAKMGRISGLEGERLVRFIIDCGFVSLKPRGGYWIADSDGGVMGVLELNSPLFAEPRPKPSLKRALKGQGLWRTARAMLGAIYLDHTPGRRECYVEHLAVSARARGRGLGGMLLDEAARQAKGLADCRSLTLQVAGENRVAVGLYRKKGFIITKEESSAATQLLMGIRNWLHMELEITSTLNS